MPVFCGFRPVPAFMLVQERILLSCKNSLPGREAAFIVFYGEAEPKKHYAVSYQ